MAQPLSDHELEMLLSSAGQADRVMKHQDVHHVPITPYLRRLLEENRELREQAGERERAYAQEQQW